MSIDQPCGSSALIFASSLRTAAAVFTVLASERLLTLKPTVCLPFSHVRTSGSSHESTTRATSLIRIVPFAVGISMFPISSSVLNSPSRRIVVSPFLPLMVPSG